MAEFYRFRSIDSLLGKHSELEEQTIYFASPEELNDPMEGLRDIVWDGDEIVWTNFFKHYVFCLNRNYWLLNMPGQPRELDVDDIPILERWDEILIPIEKSLFDDVWDRFYNLPYIQEIIEALANTRRKIRYREIVSHLQSIQTFGLLGEILKSHIDYKLIPDRRVFRQLSEDIDTASEMKTLLNAIKKNKKVEDEHRIDSLFLLFESEDDNIRLTQHHNAYTSPSFFLAVLGDFSVTRMADFPKVYVEQLDKLLWVKWYTACFTGSYHNSSVWAKYADGHKGACLIFESVENDHSNNLKLNHKTSNGSIILPFREANYADRPDKIDFFRTICRITEPEFRKLWYTDQDGKLSECAAHIESSSGGADWEELYWKNFLRGVTFKTKDWEYEQEYRLILDDLNGEFNQKNNRILTYDFNSLKGIIFGIRTSTEDKMKIIEMIEKKKECAGNNQTDFKYFQAYYSAQGGDIRARRMRLQ